MRQTESAVSTEEFPLRQGAVEFLVEELTDVGDFRIQRVGIEFVERRHLDDRRRA